MKFRWAWAALAGWAASCPAAAPAVVEALQAPAWLARAGQRLPLTPGAELRSGDQVRTGVNSRALLRLPDGSRIKLGENATFGLDRIAEETAGVRLLRASLKVFEGAFRFTTDVAARGRYRRDIQVQFGTVTAGIRGTDIWGRNFGDREVVVLLEGRMEISRGAEPPIELRESGTFYQAPASGAAGISPVPADLLNEWAQQTEMQPGRGMQSLAGRWKLELARFDSQGEALALYDSLRSDGYPARILPVTTEGLHHYSVRLTGFAAQREAAALGARLQEAYPSLAPVTTPR
jgi:FecR protein/SPOR domain